LVDYDQSLLFNINIYIESNVLIFVRSLARSGFVRVFALCLAREIQMMSSFKR
jgi:hypothetical protein